MAKTTTLKTSKTKQISLKNEPVVEDSDDDSSSEEEEEVEEDTMMTTTTTKKQTETITKDKKKTSDKTSSTTKTTNTTITPNVIYIGHLPKHCEEKELLVFLKQFGRVVQLRVCRSNKTGNSKGYAFVKFTNAEIASIVASTLNGHLLFSKRLISHVLSPEQIHSKLFSNTNTRQYVLSKKKALLQETTTMRKPKSLEKMKQISDRLVDKQQQKREQLKSMGIDYDFP